MIILEDTSQGGRHECLTQTDHIADEHSSTFVEMVGGDLDGSRLELEEPVAKVAGNAELRESGAYLLRKVVGDFQVNVIGERSLFPRPTTVDNLRQFLRDVQTPTVVPAVIEPLLEFVAGVVVKHVHVEFALLGQTCQREIAAADETDGWIIGVGAMQEIQLGVQGVV